MYVCVYIYMLRIKVLKYLCKGTRALAQPQPQAHSSRAADAQTAYGTGLALARSIEPVDPVGTGGPRYPASCRRASLLPEAKRRRCPSVRCRRRRRPSAGPTGQPSPHAPVAPPLLEASGSLSLALLGGLQGAGSSLPWPPPSTHPGAHPTSPSV